MNPSVLSQVFFSWITPLFLLGYKRPLQKEDIYPIDSSFLAQDLASNFETIWKSAIESSEKRLADHDYKSGSLLLSVLLKKYSLKVFLIGCINLISTISSSLSPLFVGFILLHVADKDSSTERAVGLIAGLFLLQIVTTLTNAHFFMLASAEGLRLRTMFSALVYRKMLRLNAAARVEFNSGRITTIVSTDTTRIESFIQFCNIIWTAPIQIIIIIGFLISKIGWAAIVGVSILILTMPLQFYLFKTLSQIRRSVAPITDKRVKKTTEVLSGIRVLKLFAWEQSFLSEIEDIRKDEINLVLRSSVFRALAMTIAFGLPVLASGIAFVVYGEFYILEAATVFPALTWFNIFPLMFVPNILTSWADFKVALSRIEDLLLAPELDTETLIDSTLPHAISLNDASFTWESQAPPLVRNISLEIPHGSLVAIVGPVGSGKSNLLNALAGEMKISAGSLKFASRLSYAPQTPWIQNASVKDNILFGVPYNQEKYSRVINSCALEHDLSILRDGDSTSIGERGINLSGGQKQRVNLARVCYFDADIILLDDPLSAVDSHVGRYLFDNCIMGQLKNKTRILVTHQLHFLSRADLILVMKDGQIVEKGAYLDLMNSKGEFATLINSYGAVDNKPEEEVSEKKDFSNAVTSVPTKKEAKDIMQVEERDVGAVNLAIWNRYAIASGGIAFAIGGLIIVVFLQSSRLVNDLWLSWWTSKKFDDVITAKGYVGIYVGLGVLQCIATYAFGIFFAFSGTRAARVLHAAAISRILRARTYFFDSTPLGRIINRFSKDQDSIDNALPDAFRLFLNTFAASLSTFVLIVYATPIFCAVLVPVLGLYYFIQSLYRSTSRELKRLDSISRSPLYANFGATLTGLPTIRAYGEQENFINRNDTATNENTAPYYLLVVAQRWLGVRLEILGALLVLAAAIFGVISTNLDPSLLGLSLSYALQVTSILSFCVRQFTDTEIAMNAVERVEYYAYRVETEAEATIPESRPPKGWPAAGTISISDLKMRYAPDLPLVLNNISFEIKDREKIGIVGRTGSGKSSFLQVLFRMVEPDSGSIVLDGVDICKIGLRDLRSVLAIIPQDPVLFSGTFRSNLDPFGEYSDADLWDAITRSGLKSKVKESELGLDGKVEEGGENLSVGQRQLVCLARAMIKKPKILIMDEATANVDYETDALIQKSLREDFSDATVLTIAHRLNTIIDYDRVLVLDNGEIKEYEAPSTLLSDESSVFFSMIAETGQTNAEMLMGLALKK